MISLDAKRDMSQLMIFVLSRHLLPLAIVFVSKISSEWTLQENIFFTRAVFVVNSS